MSATTTLPADSGLSCLCLALELLGRPVEPAHLHHQYRSGARPVDAPVLVRAARRSGLKAALRPSRWDHLPQTPRPAIAELSNGSFLLLGHVEGDRIAVLDPLARDAEGRPQGAVMDRASFEAAWTGRLLLVTTRSGEAAREGGFGLAWFLPSIVKYRAALAEVLASSLTLQILAMVMPIALQVVIDKVLASQAISTLEVMAVILLVMAVFEALLGGLRIFVFSHTANRIDVELGARFFAHMMALPLGWFQARQVGAGVARLRELDTIRGFLTSSTVTVFLDLAFTLAFLGVMLVYSPMLTAVVAAALPLHAALSLVVTPLLYERLQEKYRRNAENQSFLTEALTGVETVKGMAIEPQLQRRWEEQLAAYVTAAFRATNLGNVAGQAVGLINRLCTVALLWFGAHLVMDGALTVGELVAVNLFAAQVTGPVLRLANMWIDFQQVRLSLRRLADVLDTAPEPASQGRPPMPRVRGEIGFRRVGFRYRPAGRPVLEEFSLEIPAGQVVGIVGASGSGKSTLARLLLGLHPPESGQVLVDGIDVASVHPASLRRQVGLVLQDNLLFSGTVRENIALSEPAMGIERVMAAARLAGAHDFILADLPDGYDTLVGERGALLSGGQRQRVALARALAADPRVLVLDEATSALDAESERVILDNMRAISANRTVLIIAHRFSAIRTADRIVVLDRGRLVEDGTHAELLARGGRYAALYREQMGLMPRLEGAPA